MTSLISIESARKRRAACLTGANGTNFRRGEMSRSENTLKGIRSYYEVPAYKGVKVTAYGHPGKIVGSSHAYLMIRLDGKKEARPYHPTDGIEYHIEDYREEMKRCYE